MLDAEQWAVGDEVTVAPGYDRGIPEHMPFTIVALDSSHEAVGVVLATLQPGTRAIPDRFQVDIHYLRRYRP
jgi:hypothetical protein